MTRQLFHPRLVAKDAPARNHTRRIHGQHRHTVTLFAKIEPERLDERALSHSGNPRDPDPRRMIPVRQ